MKIILIFMFAINSNLFGKSDGSLGNKWSNSISPDGDNKFELNFAVFLPSDSPMGGTNLAPLGLASIDLAIQYLQNTTNVFENITINLEYRDTLCSSTHGPMAAFDVVYNKKPGTQY